MNRRIKRGVVESYLGPQRALARDWIASPGRPDNFYYGLTDRNARHLICLISQLFGQSPEDVEALAGELEQSPVIYRSAALLNVRPDQLYGRRLGWYLVARIIKPRLIVETGVHDGIGAVVLTEALRRNSSEGGPGIYRGTDIDTQAGWLLEPGDVDASVLYGDSIASLQALHAASVDLFVNDSDHSAEYEYREYELMTDRLSAEAVILGDNAHATDSLLQYSRAMNRSFVFFDERPKDHWYPGAGIGFSLAKK